jgi:hypothetical protein
VGLLLFGLTDIMVSNLNLNCPQCNFGGNICQFYLSNPNTNIGPKVVHGTLMKVSMFKIFLRLTYLNWTPVYYEQNSWSHYVSATFVFGLDRLNWQIFLTLGLCLKFGLYRITFYLLFGLGRFQCTLW